MVIDGDSELLLGAILADNVAVEKLLDLRDAEDGERARRLLALFILENGLANADTFIADVGAR